MADLDSVWNQAQHAISATGNAISATGMPSAAAAVAKDMAKDPTFMISAQLANALSTTGDAQFWDESISPSTVRTSLAEADPSNPNSTPTILRGMKFLLASMSKGRDVSDFYPNVVKLVGAQSLEVRKMVYMYLVQYADHDATTRELSLLSINSFQRDLVDSEQLIRALALRVLSSVRITDVLQIQILGIQKCARDKSPYVRKCAANALAKLSPRCDREQKAMLLEIMVSLIDEETSTMVLTSAIVAFTELCPSRLELLHSSYRKVCHLLTDMDEWGQVVVLDTLARYCRKFFRKPRAMTSGSAELIDRERRVRRTVTGIAQNSAATTAHQQTQQMGEGLNVLGIGDSDKMDSLPRRSTPKKVKRRVVKKGFYSDEEDGSTEEEVYTAENLLGPALPLSAAMRQQNIMGFRDSDSAPMDQLESAPILTRAADEDGDIAEDHRLLLRSSLPLLKSRNAGVVMAVCSLHYYCGVSSIKVRSALGKALVRIHRDRREIQFVVLTSIRMLVKECPSAFTPFLNDFFIKAMDPSFTRMIKLEILTSLALEPGSIEAVLKELRNYIRYNDKKFVCASIQAVGKVAELARIVYDRHGAAEGDRYRERNEADRIALNCMYGLMALTHAGDNEIVIGECAIVVQKLMLQLGSDPIGGGGERNVHLEDPNHVQSSALRRLLLLLVRSLSSFIEDEDAQGETLDKELGIEQEDSALKKQTVILPPAASASTMWIIGEWITPLSKSPMLINNLDDATKTRMRTELVRLVAQSFPYLEPCQKLQGVHFATKLLISATGISGGSPVVETALCENVLAMGRVDLDEDVRDRARFESSLIHTAIGLKHDLDYLSLSLPVERKITVESAKQMLLQTKSASSLLPLEDEIEGSEQVDEGNSFRFGTLSSLVSHRARTAYLPLPTWAAKDSSSSLRDPPEAPTPDFDKSNNATDTPIDAEKTQSSGFYDNSGDDTSSSSDDDSSSSDSSSSDSYSSSGDSSSASSDESSSESDSESDSDEDSVQSAAPPPPPTTYAKGQSVSYANQGTLVSSTIVAIHLDDSLVPYYTIRLPDGREKQTDSNHLSAPPPVAQFMNGSSTAKLIPTLNESLIDDPSSFDESTSFEDSDNDSDKSLVQSNSIGNLLGSNLLPMSNAPQPAHHIFQPMGNGPPQAGNDSPPMGNIPQPARNNRLPIDNASQITESNLLSMGNAPQRAVVMKSSANSALANGSSIVQGLEGLVMAPLVVDNDIDDIKFDNESSNWVQIVRPELSGGLMAKMRYLRGSSKAREASLIGFNAEQVTTVITQVKFENQRSDGGTLRRIRVIKRSAATGSIATRRLVIPQGIEALKKGQSSTAILAVEFQSPSNREGASNARFDIHSDRGNAIIDIKPSLGELLRSCKTTRSDFGIALARLKGISQRLESSFTLHGNVKAAYNALPESIVEQTCLTPLDTTWTNNQFFLSGLLPASDDQVYVLFKCDPTTGVGNITVCCSSTSVIASIMDSLKRAVTAQK